MNKAHVLTRKGSVTKGLIRNGGPSVFEIPSGLGTGRNSARHLKAAFLDDDVEKCAAV